ncbi:MAG TPA: membrane protein insertion efficiency factor YidD [Candidatus Saccharimonadales bacterium]|nr:membrane protein insertion efficiency factor YidD [Candidatus Saccharimonadales bacterium]
MLVFLITVYQKIVSPALKQLFGMPSMCRFTPSCSEYAKISIMKYGLVKGISLAFVRLIHCQPFSSAKVSV